MEKKKVYKGIDSSNDKLFDNTGVLVKEENNIIEIWINKHKYKNGQEIAIWLHENNIDLTTEEGKVALKLRWD